MRKLICAAILAVLLLAIEAVCLAAQDNNEQLFPVKSGKLAGFIDTKGIVVIPLLFGDVMDYTEGLAAVKDEKTGKWGYVDRTGKFVIPPQYNMAFPFSEGLANVFFEGGGEGHIDRDGRLVIKGSRGMVHDGIVTIMLKDKSIFVDKTGKTLFEAPRDAWLVGGGLVAFMQNGRMGFMDRKGKVLIQPLYHCDVNWRDKQFEEKITPVSVAQADGKAKFGFIDRSGKVVIGFQYDWAEQFFDGLAMVSKDGKYGYVNTKGKVVIPLKYECADHFSEGLAAVEVKGLWGFIDTKGRMVIQPQYLSRMWGDPMIFSEGMAAVRTETGTGVINRDGVMIIPPVYRTIEDYSGGLVQVREKGTDIYFNKKGEVVWAPGTGEASQQMYASSVACKQAAQTENETAQRLAACSIRSEAREYLAEADGIKFYGIKSQYVGDGQLWLRGEFGSEARKKLFAQMPVGAGLNEKLGDIKAVLCRIDPDFIAGKYTVIEQVWLDGSNTVIGRWAEGSASDSWPATYISQACQDFMAAWLSYGTANASVDKGK